MKKIKSIASITLCLVLVFSFSGCSKKVPVTSQEFGDVMTQIGYTVKDIKEQYSDVAFITEAYLAVDKTQSYQIEFYVTSDSGKAENLFEENKQNYEQNKSSAYVRNSYDVGNHSKYTLTTDGMYILISRIDNTLIFVKTFADYKDAVDTAADTLGY